MDYAPYQHEPLFSEHHPLVEREYSGEPSLKRPRTDMEPPRSGEVCRDFLKGRCIRSNCKFEHTYSPGQGLTQPHQQPQLQLSPQPPSQPSYYSYPLPAESRPASYSAYPHVFSYYPSPPPLPSQFGYPSYPPPPHHGAGPRHDVDPSLVACRDFLHKKCTKGENCKYAHVSNAETLPKGTLSTLLVRCSDFTNEKCNRPTCKYAHIENWKLLEERSLARCILFF
eukprot:TRINITY_DN10734_c0_g2_i17.p1 TRINITY_DN10734_c0_g2~~TRINITY_DN10734_c0_g2_i17.p1  ORF type:complete len:225 (+),score=13.01 TRINITY_DN10734_c0_g2_i17:58-732(+)